MKEREYDRRPSKISRRQLRRRRPDRLTSRDDPQTSLTLLPSLVVSAYSNDGMGNVTATGQSPSLTSTNNFINFCSQYPGLPLVNGSGLVSNPGSCNTAPMGTIPSADKIPSVKIASPTFNSVLVANEPFVMNLTVRNFGAGDFVNPNTNYLSAPQTLDASGFVFGYVEVTIEQLRSLNQTEPTNPLIFSFGKSLVGTAQNGVVTGNVTTGLPEGYYRLYAATNAANHQPVLTSISQHGSLDDAVYFTVTQGGITPTGGSLGSPTTTAVPGNTTVDLTQNANQGPQTSLTLDTASISTGFSLDGQESPVPGQIPSLTSVNNFINFCATVQEQEALADGTQNSAGFCSPVPMGMIPPTDSMPSAKFAFPTNGAILGESQEFTIQLAVNNLATGNFVNSNTNYLSAPQQINTKGLILGHVHVVIEQMESLTQATATNPKTFVYFRELTDTAANGFLTGKVTEGLPAGVYRLASMSCASNHQPVIVPRYQRGAINDIIYFTVASNSSTSPSSPTANSTTTAGLQPSISPAGSINRRAIIGGVLGGFFGLVGLVGFLFFMFKRRHLRQISPVATFTIDSEPTITPFVAQSSDNSTSTFRLLPVAGSIERYDKEKPAPGSTLGSRNDVPAENSSQGPSLVGSRSRTESDPPTRRDSMLSSAPSYHTNA